MFDQTFPYDGICIPRVDSGDQSCTFLYNGTFDARSCGVICNQEHACENCNDPFVTANWCCYTASENLCVPRFSKFQSCDTQCLPKGNNLIYIIGIVVGVAVGGTVLLGIILWYKFYWQKRHYYMRLR